MTSPSWPRPGEVYREGAVSEGPALTVAAVARRLGVAPATLRTWDRRYGLGPSAHTAGQHRRYDAVDLARLGMMRRLTLDGVTPAEAARVALATDVTATGHLATVSTAAIEPADLADAPGTKPPAASVPAAPPVAMVPDGRMAGAGAQIPLPGASSAARGLARAAMALDSVAAADIVTSALARRGVIPTWTDVVAPVLVGVGQRWAATGTGVEIEHLLAESVMGSLRTVSMRAAPVNASPILLACVAEDQHSLPLHALAAALAERHVATRVLGPRVPASALAAAVRRTGPAAIFLWAQMPGYGDRRLLERLPGLRPTPRIVLGGPGWHGIEVPDGVAYVDDLGEAVERLRESVLA
jgi:MerR family transcriptional regulator, light-induced transcriptional regulator